MTKTKSVYHTGEFTLKQISNVLGGVTAAWVNRLFMTALDKFKQLSSANSFDDYQNEEQQAVQQFITNCRVKAKERYVEELLKANGDVYDFLFSLRKQNIISKSEMNTISESEIEAIIFLMHHISDIEFIKQTLEDDINNSDMNYISTFQSMVSKVAFPPKKIGRPSLKKAS